MSEAASARALSAARHSPGIDPSIGNPLGSAENVQTLLSRSYFPMRDSLTIVSIFRWPNRFRFISICWEDLGICVVEWLWVSVMCWLRIGSQKKLAGSTWVHHEWWEKISISSTVAWNPRMRGQRCVSIVSDARVYGCVDCENHRVLLSTDAYPSDGSMSILIFWCFKALCPILEAGFSYYFLSSVSFFLLPSD